MDVLSALDWKTAVYVHACCEAADSPRIDDGQCNLVLMEQFHKQRFGGSEDSGLSTGCSGARQ